MKDIIEKIKRLKQQYPQYITTYRPASDDKIASMEQNLNVRFPMTLVSLLKYSDGIGFLDYALYGVSNRRMKSFDISEDVRLEGTRIEFICTCGGQSYWVDLHKERMEEVTFTDRDRSTELIVAHSLKEFFEKFLGKMEILLDHFDPKDVVAYFENENMPEGLAKW